MPHYRARYRAGRFFHPPPHTPGRPRSRTTASWPWPVPHTARRSRSAAEPARLTVSGGPVGVRVAYSYLPEAPGDKVTARKDGFVVARSLTWLHAGNSAPTHHEDQAGGSLTVNLGDVIELHARLTSDQARTQVALVVPMAVLPSIVASSGECGRSTTATLGAANEVLSAVMSTMMAFSASVRPDTLFDV